MSHNPPKNMYKDENGINRFISSATAPVPGNCKRWFRVEIVRKALNKEGEVLEKDVQNTDVFATNETCIGLAYARCPSRLIVKEASEFRNEAFSRPLGDSMFAGHKTENEEFQDAVKAEQLTITVN